jgi:hypothetical protein
VSILLGVPLILASWTSTSPFTQGLMTLLVASVPAWSMIAGAVGAPLKRKVAYMLGLLGFVLVFDLVAYATGWQALATGATVIRSAQAGMLVSTYQLALVSAPVVTLLLFAGKRPSVFWEAARD